MFCSIGGPVSEGMVSTHGCYVVWWFLYTLLKYCQRLMILEIKSLLVQLIFFSLLYKK